MSAAGASEPDRVPRSRPLGPWWLGVVGLAVAAVLLVAENLRAFGYAVALTLVVLALARMVLPADRAGGLAVRSRTVDVLTLLGLAGAMAFVAGVLRL